MHGMRWPIYRRAAGLKPAPCAGKRMISRERAERNDRSAPGLASQARGFAES
jgi:hypothetical protein